MSEHDSVPVPLDACAEIGQTPPVTSPNRIDTATEMHRIDPMYEPARVDSVQDVQELPQMAAPAMTAELSQAPLFEFQSTELAHPAADRCVACQHARELGSAA